MSDEERRKGEWKKEWEEEGMESERGGGRVGGGRIISIITETVDFILA